MKKLNRSFLCKLFVLIVIPIIIFLAGVLPELRYKAALKKYHLGMSLSEAQAKMRHLYPVREPFRVYSVDEPNDTERLTAVKFEIMAINDRVYLRFNDHKKLIEIRKLDHPLIYWWDGLWKMTNS